MSIIRFASYCLIVFQPFQLFSQQFPIISSCDENNICQCEISDNLEQLNESHAKQIVDSLNNVSVLDTAFQACCYHELAVYYFYEDDLIKSLNYNKKAEQLRSKFDDGLLWRTQLNIGITYYELNDYQLSIEYLKKAHFHSGLKKNYEKINIQRVIGNCYTLLGDFEKGIEYGKLSIKNKDNIDVETINQAKNDLAANLIETKVNKHIELAIMYSKEIVKQAKDHENKIMTHNNLGRAYDRLNNFNKAIYSYKNALKLSKNDTLDYAIILNNIASLTIDRNLDKKQSIAAIDTLNESIRLYKKYFTSEFMYEYAMPLENLGDVYTGLQKFDTALLYYQKALINLTNNFRNEDIFQNPNPKNAILFIYSNPDIIRVLHLKATAAYQFYKQNNNPKYLTLANQTYQTAFDFHDKLQKEISTENSRLFQAKNILSYIENALNVIYESQQKERDVGEAAFRFMEKNKATVLLQSMNEADALQFANLPDSLLNQERDLKIAITFHNKQLNEAIEYEDTTEIERLDKILFDEKQQYSQLISNLENNYYKYYQLKYQQNQTQLKDVQIQLVDHTALLEYFVGDSSIYTLLILKDSTQLFKTKKPADWEKQINHFREAFTLSNREDQLNKYNKKLFKKFVINGNALYQHLLEEPLKELHQISQLKIIPDAELNYIPFDLLLTNAVDTSSVNYKNLPYLIKQKIISYAYSAALMVEQQAADNTEKDFAYGGYAPKYDNSTNSDLPKARELVKTMASFFSGKKHLNKTATKANFLKDTLNYQILHLAMHGKLNDQYPLNSHLVFTQTRAKSVKEDYQLYASDLYLHEINADLTILNACETGTGELKKGEGVMSLSRAFTYAGCPSLMMSLWSIDEQPSAKILETFFKNIKNGSKKNTAIQQAKLDYLDNTKANFSHPYYWAGLVLSGNAEAIHFENSLSGFWWTFIVILVILGGIYTIKK